METLSLWGVAIIKSRPSRRSCGGWGRCGALRRKHCSKPPEGALGECGLPRQSAGWLGMTTLCPSETTRDADCHASDVGHWFAMTATSGAGCNEGKQKSSCIVIPRSEATWESASLVSLPRYGGRGESGYRGNGQRQRSGSGKLWWHSPFDRQRHTGKAIARET